MPGGDGAAHDGECIDGEERVAAECFDAVAIDEAPCFQFHERPLGGDVAEGLHR